MRADDFQLFLNDVGEFLENEAVPLERLLVREGAEAAMPQLAELRDKVKAKGWWAPPLPAEQGGMGLPLVAFAQLSEILGANILGLYLFNCQAPDIGNMELLLHHGSEEQRRRWLGPLARGEIRSCFSMTEPDYPGSNPVQMATTAIRDGDDYVINGRKWFTSAAEGSAFAIVMAETNPHAEKPHKRFSQIIVPTDTPGFRLVRNIPVMGESGSGYFSHGEVVYEDCRVPANHLIGEAGSGFALAQERLGPGRIHHCMRWIGICKRALDMMCRRAAERELSPGKPLASKQTIQNWIAESHTQIHASRLMVMDAAQKIDERGAKAAREEISMIKFYVAGVLHQVIDRAIQVHGALGMTDDLLLAYWYRHERGARIYDGPDEVHKAVIAKAVMRRLGSGTT